MIQIFGGIDNGITGSVGIVDVLGETSFFLTPTKSEQNYTKEKQNVTRVDSVKLHDLLSSQIPVALRSSSMFLFERPLTGGFGFKALNSAMRSLEATLNVLEILRIPFGYIDSKEWQRILLPTGTKETAELKKASMDIGIRRFPQYKELIQKHKDADGLLIAEYCRMKYK